MTTTTAAATEWAIPGTDRVISASNARTTLRRERVTKVTATVITTTVARYSRKTGGEVGVDFPTGYLLKPTEDALAKLNASTARADLRNQLIQRSKQIGDMSDDEVIALLAKLES